VGLYGGGELVLIGRYLGRLEEPDVALLVADGGDVRVVAACQAKGDAVALSFDGRAVVDVGAVAVEVCGLCPRVACRSVEEVAAMMRGKAVFAIEELGLEAAVAEFADRLWLIAFR